MRVTVTHTLNAHFVEVTGPSTAQFKHDEVAVTVTSATKPDGVFGTIICTGTVDIDETKLSDSEGWIASSAGLFMLPNQQDHRYATTLTAAFGKAEEALAHVGAVLRWRFALSGHDAVFKDTAVDAQLADGRPLDLYLVSRTAMGDDSARIDQGDLDAAVNLVTSSHREPVGHELWREAWNLRHSNPRSSLVIGVAAAEVGLKQVIALLVPEARSLVENIPSPPLDTIMRKVLPDLPIRADVEPTRRAPRHLSIAITRAVEDRNRVVHLGALPRSNLRETLLAIREFLYMLDMYAGHPWAELLLTDTNRAALTGAQVTHVQA
jgi:hypothetical protein